MYDINNEISIRVKNSWMWRNPQTNKHVNKWQTFVTLRSLSHTCFLFIYFCCCCTNTLNYTTWIRFVCFFKKVPQVFPWNEIVILNYAVLWKLLYIHMNIRVFEGINHRIWLNLNIFFFQKLDILTCIDMHHCFSLSFPF